MLLSEPPPFPPFFAQKRFKKPRAIKHPLLPFSVIRSFLPSTATTVEKEGYSRSSNSPFFSLPCYDSFPPSSSAGDDKILGQFIYFPFSPLDQYLEIAQSRSSLPTDPCFPFPRRHPVKRRRQSRFCTTPFLSSYPRRMWRGRTQCDDVPASPRCPFSSRCQKAVEHFSPPHHRDTGRGSGHWL